MAEPKEYPIKTEVPVEYELADYSNYVHVARSENDVVLTFFQVIPPIEGSGESGHVPARPVARVALPTGVAHNLARILAQEK